jgi:hypothetical protein
MAETFKQFLADSTAITAANVGSLAKLHSDALKGTKEFESITKLDPNYAKKLLIAWEGDARDYEKNDKIVIDIIHVAAQHSTHGYFGYTQEYTPELLNLQYGDPLSP